jgi:hypothetical protein
VKNDNAKIIEDEKYKRRRKDIYRKNKNEWLFSL